MNWQHLRAFVWLRARLLANQWRRLGTLNAVLMTVVSVGALVTAVPLFLGCFALGLYLIPKAAPIQLLYAWDVLIAVFLFFWSIGLITDLQRTEPLSLSKFLHLPVSVNGAFAINYLSSLVRLSLVVFVPVMLGFGLALMVARGGLLVLVLPLLVAFLLMVTALTYQFQGWLGALMSNPRRRRTVVVATTLIFVLIFQLPNLLNLFGPWSPQRRAERSSKLMMELAEHDRAFRAHPTDPAEHLRRQREIMERHKLAGQQADRETAARWGRVAQLANMILPPGWLPFGVMSAAEGRPLPSILCLVGLTAIGSASLWRAYHGTIAQYQGQSTHRAGRRPPAKALMRGARPRKRLLLEVHLPGVSEPASAVALGSFWALARAPEAKMALLTPVIMVPIFGSLLWNSGHAFPESARPLLAIGGMATVLAGFMGIAGNQFGFDRDGFRVLVLSAASRRDILLGKNLASAPATFAMGTLLLAFVQILCPMRLDHFLAMGPQFLSMYLLYCMLSNLVSIYAPLYIAAGTLKPSNPKLSTVFLQLVMVLVLFPLTQALTLLPLGIEVALRFAGRTGTVPVALLLGLVQAALIVLCYRWCLGWQADLLQMREQSILERVTGRAS